MGVPIYLPESVPLTPTSGLPLLPQTAATIGARLRREGVAYHLPPEI